MMAGDRQSLIAIKLRGNDGISAAIGAVYIFMLIGIVIAALIES